MQKTLDSRVSAYVSFLTVNFWKPLCGPGDPGVLKTKANVELTRVQVMGDDDSCLRPCKKYQSTADSNTNTLPLISLPAIYTNM